MSKVFDGWLDELSKKSGYSWDFLNDLYGNIMVDEGYVDPEYFEDVTLERDW